MWALSPNRSLSVPSVVSLCCSGDEERHQMPSQHRAWMSHAASRLSCSPARRSRRRRTVIAVRYCLSGRLRTSAAIATAASSENHIGLVPAAGAASVCIVHRVCSRAQRSRRSRSIKMSRVLLGDEERIVTPVAARAPIAPTGTGCPRFAPRPLSHSRGRTSALRAPSAAHCAGPTIRRHRHAQRPRDSCSAGPASPSPRLPRALSLNQSPAVPSVFFGAAWVMRNGIRCHRSTARG